MKIMARSAAFLAVLALPAMAEETRTVSWYLVHRAEMNAKLTACNDDPGHAAHDPNCENAHQARITLSADEARAQFNQMMADDAAKEERTWRSNPRTLLSRLQLCNGLPTAEARRMWNCQHAYAAGQDFVRQQRAWQP
jgi:hypothetical protein